MNKLYIKNFKRAKHCNVSPTKTLLSIWIFILISFFTNNVFAQVSAYTFSQTSGTYTPITGGTAVPQTAGTSLDDNTFTALPIGFAFKYHGISYTTFGINANGWIVLGSGAATAPSSNYDVLTNTTPINDVIAAFNDDLHGRQYVAASTTLGSPTITVTSGSTAGMSIGDVLSGNGIATGATITALTASTITASANCTSTGSGRNIRTINGGSIRYQTLGTAPNRTLVVQWKSFSRYTTLGTTISDVLNFQIRLNECSNTVTTVYDVPYVNTTTSITAQVGLRGAAGTDFNTRTTTTNWSATTAGGSNAATCTLTPSVFPASGQTYTWTPNFIDVLNVSTNTGSAYCQGSGSSNTINILTCNPSVTWSISPITDLSVFSGTGNGTTVASPNTTTTYTVTSTDGVSSATSSFTVNVTPTPDVTPRNYGICKDASAPGGTVFTSAAITCPSPGTLPKTQTINFNIPTSVTQSASPGTTFATATMVALPAGSVVTSASVLISGTFTPSVSANSWGNEVRVSLAGAIADNALVSGGGAGNTTPFVNFTRTLLPASVNIAGGTINLGYWESANDGGAPDCVFPTGAVGTITINYNEPIIAQVEWYDAASGGTLMQTGLTFNPFAPASGTPLTTATAGSTNYFARCTGQTCNDTATVIVSEPTANITSNNGLVLTCSSPSTTLTSNGGVGTIYLWSNGATTASITTSSIGVYAVTATNIYGCTVSDSESISEDKVPPTADAGSDTEITCTFPSRTLSASGGGTYLWSNGATTSSTNVSPSSNTTYTVTVTSSTNGCTDEDDVLVTVNNSTASGTQTESACASYTWSATGTSYTSSGTYTYTFTGGAANGCDSTATLNLTILNPASGTQTTSACVDYTWSATGTTYTSSGTYTHTFTGGAANGCDSTATLNLTILNPASGTQTTSACVDYTWSATGTTYTSSGTYTHTFTGGAANGCDSTATLNLTILNPASGTQTTSACVDYTWSATGTTYTSSGTYTHTFTGGAANGCDSTATLNLTILNPASGTQTESACASYTWSATGTSYTSSGTYTHTFTGGAANGCDSTATLNLTILNPASGTQTESACASYTWSATGTSYTSSGTYTYTFTGGAANGCDSTATLNLTILNPASGTQTESACASYTWSATGTSYSSSGTYTHTFTGGAANGCDSTATLNLTILNPASGTQTTSACVNYTWSATGTTYTSSGTYTHTFTGGAANGCDSTATLNLTILNPASGTQTTSACVNYTWSATGTSYTSSGTYTHTFTGGAANGCDSTATLNLTINTPPASTTGLSICKGGSAAAGLTAPLCNSTTVVTTFTLNANPAHAENTVGTLATIPISIPAGATVTSTIISAPNIGTGTACSGTWQSDIRFGLTGAIATPTLPVSATAGNGQSDAGTYTLGTGTPLNGHASGATSFNYVNTVTSGITTNTASNVLNLIFINEFDDCTGSNETELGAFPKTVTVTYTYVTSTLNWFATATGGSSIGTGTPFNPVGVSGSGLTNTNTPGVYTYYAACGINDCRTPASIKIYDIPSITTAVPTCAPNATITVTSPALNNANHTGADIGVIEYSLDGGAYQTSNVFTSVTAGSHTVAVRNSANPACASSTTSVSVPQSPTVTGAVACQSGGITPSIGLQATGCSGTQTLTGTATFTLNAEPAESQVSVTIATIPLSLPTGSNVTSLNISVTGITANPPSGNWESDLRFGLSGAIAIGVGASNSGTYNVGTGTPLDGHAPGTFDFYRTVTTGIVTTPATTTLNLLYLNAGDDCSGCDDDNFGTMPRTITVTYTYTTPILTEWYLASTGGSPIYTGNTFNPLTQGGPALANTNTNGVNEYYAQCSGSTCTRTLGTFKIYDKPDITSITSTPPTCLNESTITVNASIDNANHTGIDIGTIEYSIDGTTWQSSNTFAAAPGTTYTLRTRNTARNVCFNSSSYTTGVALSGTIASSNTCATCTLVDGQGTYVFRDASGNYIAGVSDNNDGTALDATDVCVEFDGSVQSINGTVYAQRHWDISPTNNMIPACVDLYITQAELDAMAAAAGTTTANLIANDSICLSLFHGAGEAPNDNVSGEVFSAPAGLSITANNPTAGIYKMTVCPTEFSGAYCHVCNPAAPNVLPVDLIAFTGKNVDKKYNLLQWKTENEINLSHYEIQKSSNSRTFVGIGNVMAFGNTNSIKDYDFKDFNTFNGHNYYRLKMIDINGNMSYSNVIDIYLKSKLEATVKPNPATANINLEINGVEDKNINIQMFDAAGRLIETKETYLNSFNTVIPFDIQKLSVGMYYLRLTTDNETNDVKFIKQ
jgi:hypothetical protein